VRRALRQACGRCHAARVEAELRWLAEPHGSEKRRQHHETALRHSRYADITTAIAGHYGVCAYIAHTTGTTDGLPHIGEAKADIISGLWPGAAGSHPTEGHPLNSANTSPCKMREITGT